MRFLDLDLAAAGKDPLGAPPGIDPSILNAGNMRWAVRFTPPVASPPQKETVVPVEQETEWAQ